jgi:hypothetical protein
MIDRQIAQFKCDAQAMVARVSVNEFTSRILTDLLRSYL